MAKNDFSAAVVCCCLIGVPILLLGALVSKSFFWGFFLDFLFVWWIFKK